MLRLALTSVDFFINFALSYFKLKREESRMKRSILRSLDFSLSFVKIRNILIVKFITFLEFNVFTFQQRYRVPANN